MFTKTLFFLLLAYSFAYVSEAQPIEENIRKRRSSTAEIVAEQLREIEEKIKSFFEKIGSTFTNWWNTITGKKSREQKAKLEELKRKFDALKEESEAALQAKQEEVRHNVERQEQILQRTKEQGDVEIEAELNKWKAQFEAMSSEGGELIKQFK